MWRRSIEGSEVELAKAGRVGEPVHLDDSSVPYREPSDRKGLTVQRRDHSDRAVDERRLYYEPEPGIELGLPNDRGRPTDFSRSGCSKVGSKDDIGVENRDQSIEVTIARRREEGIDDLSLSV